MGRMPTVGVTACALLLYAGWGCEPSPARVGGEVTDSASIRIVTYPALDSASGPLVVDPEPLFRVGLDPSGRLFDRIEDAAVVRDGRIVVVDGRGTQELVVLDRTGEVLAVLGGMGEGPGEFVWAGSVTPWGTSGFVVQDERQARMSMFEDGEFTESYQLPPLEHKTVLGRVDDRAVFGPPLRLVMGRLYPDPWRRVAVTVSAPPFATEDTLLVLDWDQSLDFNGRDPWAASGVAAFDGERVVYGRGDLAQISWYGLDGALQQVVRWASGPQLVTDSAFQAFADELRGRMAGQVEPGFLGPFLEQIKSQHRGVVPYFGPLFVDSSGNVWLGEFLRPGERVEGRQQIYFVFSADGEALGAVRLPATLRVMHIGSGLVVGNQPGPYGESSVVAYSVHDGGADGS